MAGLSARTFVARWGGDCDKCGDRFDAGETAGYLSGYENAVCEDCLNGKTERTAPDAPLCKDCFTHHVGECW